ncbi:hypothetical protein J132_09257 [Termitomyces sp. J132]|nr:hypothetical protein J132_09257 [Termitomyces sp. J132]
MPHLSTAGLTISRNHQVYRIINPRVSGRSQDLRQAAPDTAYSAPIFRLPVEILFEIFGCLDEDRNHWNPRGPPITNRIRRRTFAPDASLDPAILVQVSMLWRAIALSTPLLWSSIAIHCTRRQPNMHLLEAWLERSGDAPLSIVFVESIHGFEGHMINTYNPVSNPFSSEVMTILMAHSHRWKAVDFKFARRIPEVLSGLKPGSLPILETAVLSSRYSIDLPYGKLPPLEEVWDAFHSSQSLTRGYWEIDYLESNLKKIPWSRLTSIEVTMMIASLFEVLPQLQNLVDLHFIDPYSCYNAHLLQFPERRPTPEAPVTLPYLRKLHLVTMRTADEIFNKLTLPSLVSVHVEQKRVWLYRPDPSVFRELLLRSRCSLKEYIYDISGDPIAEDILLDILSSQTMSSLKYLTVEPPVTEKFTDVLTRNLSEGNARILPQLEHLALRWCKKSSGGLLAMARSRSQKFKADGFAALCDLQVWRWDRTLPEGEGLDDGANELEGMLLNIEAYFP